MKKLRFLLILFIIIFGISNLGSAKMKVRAFGGVGYTAVEIPGSYWDWSNLNARGGVQVLFEAIPRLSVGAEIGFLHAYWFVPSIETRNIQYLNITAVAEFNYSIFIAQAGLGPYFGIGWNDTVPFGLMLASGIEIPITPAISIPILARFDFIFENWAASYGSTVPISLLIGLTVKI